MHNLRFTSLGTTSKVLLIAGVALIALGLLLHFVSKMPSIGRMPGDILIKKPNFTFYFPISTSLLVSLLLSIVLYLINKFRS